MHVAKGFKPIGLVSLFASLLLAPLHLQAQDPLQIGSEKQLFVGPWAQDGRDEYLAESRDGIHWTKPNLGVCEWNGLRDNNIILPNDDFPFVFSEADSASVFIDVLCS